MSAASNPLPGIQPGEPAPDFTLPAVHRDGTLSLSEYRGKTAVLLAIFRGLYCPFCRHAIASLNRFYDPLRAAGVEAVGVVATKLDNARLYFRYRPTLLPLVSDPELVTHRDYRLPRPEVTPALMKAIEETRANPTGELPEAMPLFEASEALARLHRFTPTETDNTELHGQFGQMKGQFLIDREGIVRWQNVECAKDGLGGFGRFPTGDELLKAARTLA